MLHYLSQILNADKKGFSLVIILSLSFGFVCAQTVKPLTINQLEDRINKGGDTVYVVNFWATWCAPCIAELPYFEKLQSAYKNEPLKVLLVSLDMKSKLDKVVIPFVKRNNLQNEVFLLNEANEQEYIDRISKEWSGALPATLVYNMKKNIRNFYEQEFSFAELEKIYQLSK